MKFESSLVTRGATETGTYMYVVDSSHRKMAPRSQST